MFECPHFENLLLSLHFPAFGLCFAMHLKA